MNNTLMFSSKYQAWATRWEDFNKWNERFNFTLDVCAGNGDQKCAKYFTPEDDGLSQSWLGETFFCNPPYGREYPEWVKYACYQAESGELSGVILIPARTDTIIFHDYLVPMQEQGYLEIEFLRGRLTFGSDDYWKLLWESPAIAHDGYPVHESEFGDVPITYELIKQMNLKHNSLYGKVGKMNPAPFPSMLVKFGECKEK